MKIALLLPGYLDSPNYLHMQTFEKGLGKLGYTVEILDPCLLWETGNIENYSVSNYLKQMEERVSFYESSGSEEIILVGHSMGGFMAIVAGSRIAAITKIISLCPPADREYSDEDWPKGTVRISKRELPTDSQTFREFRVPYYFVVDGRQYSAIQDVKNIHKPLMIFIALEDTVVPPAVTEKIVANANKPYVVRQEHMGHDFRRSQKQCDIVMSKIETFLLK